MFVDYLGKVGLRLIKVKGPQNSLQMSGNIKTLSTSSNGPVLQQMARSLIPPLTADKYKGQCGRVAVIGGCKEYTGAPYFAAISAMKVGADLAHVFCTGDAATVIKSYSPELIVHPVLDSPDAGSQLSEWLGRMHAVVIGPGLGRDNKLLNTIKEYIGKVRALDLPLVIDADGLWLLLSDPGLVRGYSKAILTPNAIEFARLQETVLGIRKTDASVFDVNEVVKLSEALGHVTIVRKGITDVITDGRSLLICDAKGSPRRCGGQGDLLSGSLATFAYWSQVASKENVKDAVLAAHGPSVCAGYAACLLTRHCAEKSFEEFGRSTTTTDLISHIHKSFDALF